MQLEKILGSKTKIKVLRKLATQPNWRFSIAELASDVGLDKALVSRAIADLEKLNVVKALRKGPVKLVSINKKNEFVRTAIIPVFIKPDASMQKICKELISKLDPQAFGVVSVLLYGSSAKGTFTPASDIDIMVVVKKQTAELKQKLDKIVQEFGEYDVVIFYDVITEAELSKLASQREPMIIDMLKNHKVLWGKEVSQ